MTKTKSTKRALLSSVMALFLCFTMLLGTTFAWFTDSVTSAGNKIMSGNLKIDLELLDKTSGEWNSIKEDKTALFNYENWEPGYTEVKMLKVENEGTLALKWKAKFVSENELGILADVIDVYVLPYGVLDDATGVAYPADRNLEGYTKVGTLREFVNTIESTTYGNLEAGEAAYLGIALKMQETAGNTYQDQDLGAFDIMILATQLTSENDSFDNQYDANAKFDEPTKVATVEELTAALENGEPVELVSDITITESMAFTVAEDTTTVINLNGNDLTVQDDSAATKYIINSGELVIEGEGTLTVRQINNSNGGTLTLGEGVTLNADGGAYAVINGEGATLNVDGATINYSGSNAAIQNNGGEIVITDASVVATGSDGYAIDNNFGTLVVNGGTFTKDVGSMGNVIHQGYEGEIIINGGTFIQKSGDSLANIEYGGKLTINGGVFEAVSEFASMIQDPNGLVVNAGEFRGNAVSIMFGFDSITNYVPTTSTATTNADDSITVTVNE